MKNKVTRMWQKGKFAKFDFMTASVAVTADLITALFKAALPKNGIAEKEEVGAGEGTVQASREKKKSSSDESAACQSFQK